MFCKKHLLKLLVGMYCKKHAKIINLAKKRVVNYKGKEGLDKTVN